MKKIKLLGLLVIFTNIIYAVPSSINAPVDGSGWRFNQHKTGLHGIGKGVGHADDTMAWDINYGSGDDDAGLPIYAVESGKIYTENGWGGSSVGQLLINHTTNGDNWSTGYLHMRKIVKKSGTVKKGEIIGYLSDKGTPNSWHLHFAVYNTHGKYALKSVNVNIKHPTNYPLSDSEDNSNESIIDGAGSLVSSIENIEGGNHDYALMHPHPSSKSTVVFQWLYDVDSCSHIDLFSYPNALDVTVQAKKWNGHLIKKAFNVTLNAYNQQNLNSTNKDLSNGISLKKADNSCTNDNNCDWTTLAVTSKKPLKSNEYIIAHCQDNSSSIKRGNRQDITPKLVSLHNNYFWTGTGSLISKLEDRNFESAGVGKDYAATYNSKKSFTTFQWYANDNCRKIKIQGYKESSSVVNEVAFKEWNASSWKSSKCGNSLPCTIVAPKIGEYFIIKVKSNAGAIGTEYLQTECVE